MSTAGAAGNGYFKIPSVTTTERDLLAPVDGMIVKNSTNGRLEFRVNSNWSYPVKNVSFMAMSGSTTMTNQTNAEVVVLAGNGRIVWKGDLSKYKQCRLIIRLSVGSASANSPRLYLKYSTDNSTYSAISSPESSCSLVNTGFVDTGWFDMVAGACVNDVYIQPYVNGGNGVADPALDSIVAMFR